MYIIEKVVFIIEWYALFVETGKEELVKTYIHKFLINCVPECLIPKRKVAERRQGKIFNVTKIMFPGYVLIYTEMNNELYSKILNIPRVYKVLTNCSNYNNRTDTYYSPITYTEIQIIKNLLGKGDTVNYSKLLLIGGQVYVKSGPLIGMEGVIKKVDKRKRRAKVLLKFLQKEVLIELGIEILSDIKDTDSNTNIHITDLAGGKNVY